MEGEGAVEREERVRVQGMKGLTLLVTPESEEPDSLLGDKSDGRETDS